MRVSVVYASPDQQIVLNLDVPAGTTVSGALVLSGIYSTVPYAEQTKVGIFGNVTSREAVLQPGDRVEIYRPLNEEPKEARRRRVRRR